MFYFCFIFLSPVSIAATSSNLATKDSYVESYSATSNYGGADWLIFGFYLSNLAEAYIGFDTSSPPSGWTKAEVEIDMYFISETTQLTISLITENWDELSITWIYKPTHGQEITKLTVATEQIYSIDVTNFISGSSLSICINATSLPTGYVQATSREGHTGGIFEGPKLKWTYPSSEAEAAIPGFNLILFCGFLLGTTLYLIKKIKTKGKSK